MSTETAVTNPQTPPVRAVQKIRDLLNDDNFRAAIQKALPEGLSADHYLSTAFTATMRTPELLNTTPNTFFTALRDLASLGLEPDGRRAHLIPFRNRKNNTLDCQLIVDFKGLAELVRRSGEVAYLHCDAVHMGDLFEYQYGTGAFLRHKPAPGPRTGEITGFYSFVRFKGGAEDFMVLAKDEVDKVRARSKAKDAGPWVTDFSEMGKKTAFRRHSKWLPFSSTVRRAIEIDDELTGGAEDGTGQAGAANSRARTRSNPRRHRPPRHSATRFLRNPVFWTICPAAIWGTPMSTRTIERPKVRATVTAADIPGTGLVRVCATCAETGRTVKTVCVPCVGIASLLRWLTRECPCKREHVQC